MGKKEGERGWREGGKVMEVKRSAERENGKGSKIGEGGRE